MLGEEDIKKMAKRVATLVSGECKFEYLTAVHMVLNGAGVPKTDRGYYISILSPEEG